MHDKYAPIRLTTENRMLASGPFRFECQGTSHPMHRRSPGLPGGEDLGRPTSWTATATIPRTLYEGDRGVPRCAGTGQGIRAGRTRDLGPGQEHSAPAGTSR